MLLERLLLVASLMWEKERKEQGQLGRKGWERPGLLVTGLPTLGFSHGSVVKNPPANARDAGSIPGLGRFPGEGDGNPLQYFCLENPMNRGAWWTTVHGVSKSQILLSDWTTRVTSDPTHHAATSTFQETDAGWMCRTFPVGPNRYPRLCCAAAGPGFGLESDRGEERRGERVSRSVTPDFLQPRGL